jgi:hypothetical protein
VRGVTFDQIQILDSRLTEKTKTVQIGSHTSGIRFESGPR